MADPTESYMINQMGKKLHSKRSETIDTGTLPSNTHYLNTVDTEF